MARVNLRCACGFYFSVTDAQLAKPEGVRCPSCMAPVGIDGPVAGGPAGQPVRALQSAPDTAGLKVKIGIGVGAAVLILGIVAVLMLKGGSPPEPPPQTATTKRPAPAPVVPTKKAPAPKTAPTPKAGTTPTAEATPAAEPVDPAPRTGTPVPAPSPSASVPPLPDDLLRSVKDELLSLKEWHLNLATTAPEKARVNALVGAGKGGPEDVEFLKSLLNGPRFRVVKEEATMIRENRTRLDADALEGLPVDRVVMADGRVLNGRIVDETEAVVRLERRLTKESKTVMPLPKPDIKEVQKGKGNGGEFKTRWETAKKEGPAGLAGLLAWCKENSLTLQASLAAFAILADDPGRTEARQEAGLSADPVARMQEAEKQGGFIPYEGRNWVPSELKAKLQRDGYVLLDGRWMKKSQEPKIFSVPNLFRYETQSVKPVQIAGNLAQEETITYNVTGGQEKPVVTPKRRFYAAGVMTLTTSRIVGDGGKDADEIILEDKGNPEAGKDMHGEVYITVPVNAPILEASVMTSAEVKAGGKIAVSLILDGGHSFLYNCAPKESQTRKLPDAIRGKTEVRLVADIRGIAAYTKKSETKRVKGSKKDTNRVIERGLDMTFNQLIPDYSAMLFPSNANTFEVFRLTVTLAEPAPAMDKLFENAADVLKK